MSNGANYGLDKGYLALSTYNSSNAAGVQAYRVTKIAAGGTFDLQAASNALALGVVQENVDQAKVATGKAVVNIRITGITKVVAGAAITQGVEVMATTGGKVITAATTGNRVIGILQSSAAADGDIVDMLIVPGGRIIP